MTNSKLHTRYRFVPKLIKAIKTIKTENNTHIHKTIRFTCFNIGRITKDDSSLIKTIKSETIGGLQNVSF